jgi:hypothetical protein
MQPSICRPLRTVVRNQVGLSMKTPKSDSTVLTTAQQELPLGREVKAVDGTSVADQI